MHPPADRPHHLYSGQRNRLRLKRPLSSNSMPSFSSKRRWRASPPLRDGDHDTAPFALTTRCHGTSVAGSRRWRTWPTRRPPLGNPAIAATWPYVATQPLGIRRITAEIAATALSPWDRAVWSCVLLVGIDGIRRFPPNFRLMQRGRPGEQMSANGSRRFARPSTLTSCRSPVSDRRET